MKEIPEIEAKIESGALNLTILSIAGQTFKQENVIDVQIKKDVIAQLDNNSKRGCEKILKDIFQPKLPPKETALNLKLSDETLKTLNDIKALVAHRKLGQNDLFSLIFKTAYEKLLNDRFKLNSTRETKTKNPRFITAQQKKLIYNRDKACTKCGSNYALQIDHIKPYALGGKTTPDNLRLLCRSCNKRAQINAAL